MPEDVKTPEELSQLKFQLKNEKMRCVEIASQFGFKGHITADDVILEAKILFDFISN